MSLDLRQLINGTIADASDLNFNFLKINDDLDVLHGVIPDDFYDSVITDITTDSTLDLTR